MKKFYWPTKVKDQKPIAAPTKSGVLSCQSCGLYAGCKTPQMPPHGEGRLRIAVIAEAPGSQEDLQGIQLIGDAGQVLRTELSQFGIDLDRDCIKSNSVSCRPPSNRKPTNLEIECCRRNIWQPIKEFQPRAIWLMGGSSIKSFFFDFESGEPSINKWRGWCIPNYEFNAFVFPMYHPSYILRNPKDQGLKFVFHQDIENAIKNLKRPLPKFVKPIVHKLTNRLDIETVLRQANEDNRIFTFDYETTGLKPYREGHKIVYSAFSRDGKEAFAFPFPGNEKLWKTILRNQDIPKSAHNMKFEELWSREILDTEVQNWVHCSMLCAHVLDDRSDITSLKFQITCRYGEMKFKDDSDPYLKAPHGNDFNNILKAPLDLMLQRVGDDAGWEARLYYDQVKELKAVGNTGFQTLQYGFDFFREGSLALVDAEQAGMKIDEEYLLGKKGDPKDKGVKGQLEKEIAGLKVSILDNRYVKQFFGGKFNPKSDVQLKKLLYSDMKLVPTAFTAPTKAHPEGTPKVDKAALEWIAADKNHPMCDFVSDVLQFKKQSTLHSTFVVGLLNEVCDEELHPFFNLHLARTYRSTSNLVNFKNIPMRDKENSYLVRSAFYPYPGRQLLEADFSGIEVRVA
jgi:uracil-DNA glycosylase family 4